MNLVDDSGQALQLKNQPNKKPPSKTKQKKQNQKTIPQQNIQKPQQNTKQNTKAIVGTILDAKIEIWPESFALVKVKEHR